MKAWMFSLAVAGAMAGLMAVSAVGAEKATANAANTAQVKGDALAFTVKDIDGKDVNLSEYKGKVVMIVNVASKCGNTPQYKQLEEMYNKYKDQGFVILGFPANNFGGQEPGTDSQIKEFCTSKYSVTFPMFSKVSVKGDDKAPLYKYLTSLDTKPKGKGEVSWNFEKFLIGKDGSVVARFEPKTKPDDAKVVSAIEAQLKK
jgi:glutathione peroxidase